MISYYLRTIQDRVLRKIPEFVKGCLIYCKEPNSEELEFLKNKFKINENLLKDALDPYEIPRIEEVEGKVYIFLRAPLKENGRIFTAPLLIVVSQEFFLLFSQNKFSFLEEFLEKEKHSIFTTQKTKLFLQIFSKICEVFKSTIIFINKEIKRAVFEIKKIEEEEIKEFIRFEVILQDFMSTLVSIKVVLAAILQKQYLELFPADRELIDDLVLEINQLEEISKSSVKNIVYLREGHEIIFTNTVNKVIKILTAYTILVSIPTILASLYGMNVKLPFEENKFAFFIVLSLSLVLMFLVALIFKWKKWL
jgi:magnesium transporter